MNAKSIHLQDILEEEGLLNTHRLKENDHHHLDKSEPQVHFESTTRRSLDSLA